MKRNLIWIFALVSMLAIAIVANGQCLQGDVNADGIIDIDDAVYLFGYAVAGGPEPVPCNDCLDIGTYTTDSSQVYHYDYYIAGDSLYSVFDTFVYTDSFEVSLQGVRHITRSGTHVYDTTFVGVVLFSGSGFGNGGQ